MEYENKITHIQRILNYKLRRVTELSDEEKAVVFDSLQDKMKDLRSRQAKRYEKRENPFK